MALKRNNLDYKIKHSDIEQAQVVSLSLLNGWSIYNAGWSQPQAIKTVTGLVVLSGILTGGAMASATDLAILPIGLRPNKTMIFGIELGAGVKAQVYIMTTGAIRLAQAISRNDVLSLDGISFFI